MEKGNKATPGFRLQYMLLLREPQGWVGRQIRATEVILQLHSFPPLATDI